MAERGKDRNSRRKARKHIRNRHTDALWAATWFAISLTGDSAMLRGQSYVEACDRYSWTEWL
ncbi:MAG: hypothetical protein ACKO9A_11185, partial [Alphaproteobacteria bacterium]